MTERPSTTKGRRPRSRMRRRITGARRARGRPRLRRRGVRDRGRSGDPEGPDRRGGQRSRERAGRRPEGPPALRDQLHHLPRAEPAGRARPRAVADRRRLGASVYFQVSTGRMPATQQGAQVPQKKPKFDEQRDAAARGLRAVGRRRARDPDRRPARVRRRPGRGRRAVPAQLRLLPRLRRPGRRAVRRASTRRRSTTPATRRSGPRCCPARRTCRCSATTS